MPKTEKEWKEESLCPDCEGGYRHLTKLSNNKIILTCETCSSVWLNPLKIDWCDASSDIDIESHFNCNDSSILFRSSNWASYQEILDSEWKNFYLNNPLVIKIEDDL
ncbi:hypothetical protein QLL95_gp0399 [Cotonvirus japonicus]|uniref:Uncharacterized protein n=1 Tax=Cotonvirus japonicus TaxID=2811091 RepID=A0ABM7NU64_9VIRU|nr:hypothetical protein QLL95_gp0399 [Cotonvirus japonicus]BCS83724.1 hypothetical protein [Cotonvirus japonicus]